MAVLYILGAGCSKNYAQSLSKVPDITPPLNADFFKIAKKIADYYELDAFFGGRIVGFGHFLRDMNRLYGYGESENDATVFDDKRLTLESVMNYFYTKSKLIDYDSSLGGILYTGNSRIRVLNELLALVLVETMTGGPCDLHKRLAHLQNKGDIIWSLNYDILMDIALYQAGKLSDSGYSMRFDYTITSRGFRETVQAPSPIKMFKLHGSLNWLHCTTCDRNILLRDENNPVRIWKRIGDLDVECPNCRTTRYVGLERLLVPPAAAKDFDNASIRYLWKAALGACKNVDRIVSIGFSFSSLDFELEMILRSLVESGDLSADTPITLVSPTPAAPTARFNSVFNRSEINTAPSLRSFVK